MSDITLESAHDDLEAFVLGALDSEEERRFGEHLHACDECRNGLASYVPVTNALRTIPVVAAPALPQLAPAAVTPMRKKWSFAPVTLAYLAAAAVLLLVIGGGFAAFTRSQTDRQLMTVAGMMADGPHQAAIVGDGVRGRVIIGHRNLRAAVILRGLSAAPSGSAYHVWLVDDKPVLVGALSPARDNLEVLLFDARQLNGGHTLRVSLEPVDASAPSGATVASGTY